MGLQDILKIEPGSVIWTIITFLLIVWLIGKFGWKPILSGLKSREDAIRNDLETAKTMDWAATIAGLFLWAFLVAFFRRFAGPPAGKTTHGRAVEPRPAPSPDP